jgi:hypothetical protein
VNCETFSPRTRQKLQTSFFKVVDTVAELEKKLGIYELAQFTPK